MPPGTQEIPRQARNDSEFVFMVHIRCHPNPYGNGCGVLLSMPNPLGGLFTRFVPLSVLGQFHIGLVFRVVPFHGFIRFHVPIPDKRIRNEDRLPVGNIDLLDLTFLNREQIVDSTHAGFFRW